MAMQAFQKKIFGKWDGRMLPQNRQYPINTVVMTWSGMSVVFFYEKYFYPLEGRANFFVLLIVSWSGQSTVDY